MREVLSGCNVIGHGIFGSMASNSEPPQPPNYDNIEMEGIGSVTLPNSLKAPIERLQLLGNSTQGCTIKVLSTELEQGTINAGNGENFPSNYRVRTKGFSDIQKGKYKVTCEGAKQANIIFYSTDGIYKNTLFKAHTVFPFYFTANEACKIRVAVSNGTEAEAIAIKPENVKSITVATEETPEYPQEIVSSGKYDETSGKYLIDVSVTGKNLIPFPYPKLGGVGTTGINNGITYTVLKDRGIKLTGKALKTVFINLLQNFEFANNKKYVCSDGLRTDPNNGLIFYSVIEGNSINKTYYPQIEHGNVATDYEPYKEPQTITLALDRPLTKWDRIEKREGVCGIVYKHKTVDDLATLVKDNTIIYGSPGKRYFSIVFKDVKFNYDYTKAYSEIGLYKKDINVLYAPMLQTDSIVISINDTDTIETAKEHLHYKFIYETDSEEFVPLPEETQIALENLHANDGTTVISVDSGEVETGIKLTYRKEK